MVQDGEITYESGGTAVLGTDVDSLEEGAEGLQCVVSHDGRFVGFGDRSGGIGVRASGGGCEMGGGFGVGDVVDETSVVG